MSPQRCFSNLAICIMLAVGAGCGGGDSGEPSAATESAADATSTTAVLTADSAGTSPVPSSGSTANTTPVTEPAPAATEPPASGSDFDDLAACMTGNWIMIAEEVQDMFSDTQLGAVPGLQVTVAGEGLLALDGSGTYSYTPGYTATISMLDITSTGEWSGSTQGTWVLDGNALTMRPTSNDISGSMTIMGNTSPLPAIGVFDGSGTVVDCNPATMEIQLDTPVGSITHTLLAG